MKRIGIVIIATNSYLALGVRFIKRFIHFYEGSSDIRFCLFTENDPYHYFSPEEYACVVNIKTEHKNWVDGTNSKFKNIITICDKFDEVYYFDADTNIDKPFDDWYSIGDLVGGEHYGNKTFLAGGIKIDTNPGVMSFTPTYSPLPFTYFYGAFFGGKSLLIKQMCTMLNNWQLTDKVINYEPPVNDESYINKYFHFCPPSIVSCQEFKFLISDKGGIGETRNSKLNIDILLAGMKELKNCIYDIQNGQITNVKLI